MPVAPTGWPRLLRPAHGADGQAAVDGDLVILGHTPALAAIGKAGRFQAQRAHDGEGVVQFEKIQVVRIDARLAVGFLAADVGCLQKERIAAVMDGQRVVGAGAGQDLHGAAMVAGGELMGAFRGHKHDCGRAVADRAAVHHVDGRGDERRFAIDFSGDGALEHGVGVVGPVAMGVDAEAGKGVDGHVVLVHVALHDQRVEAHEADAVQRLVLGIGGGGQARGRVLADGVGHLFHARDHDHIVKAAGHGHGPDAQGRAAAGAGRLDLGRFDAVQPAEVGDQRGQMLLLQQAAAEHVAHKERVRAFDAGFSHGPVDGIVRDLSNRTTPQFADLGLADAYD